MKSAYELAMERLAKTEPVKKLTAMQKAKIAEIDAFYKSKLAERETFLHGLLAKAESERNREEAAELRRQLGRDLTSLREECEAKKEKVRQE
jgi:hypothetical protein